MAKKITISIIIFLLLVAFSQTVVPVNASSQPQVLYQTPTANADGRILYTVKANDTCLSISLTTGVDINTLKQLNKLDEQCTLIEGKQLLLGVFQTPTVTPGPTPTATPVLPTPTPFNGNGKICIFLFNDINGNALAETGESQVAGGAISLTDKIGKISLTAKTTNEVDPVCFNEVPEGEYNISVAPPEGYNATTNMNYALSIQAGDQSILDFGAQLSSQAATPAPAQGGKSPILGILGGILLLGGAGLAIYMVRFRKRF
jgi:LysM repeat protein